MSKLLFIESSPRSDRSHSSHVAEKLIETWQQQNSSDTLTRINLFQAELPAFDGNTIAAKYAVMHGQQHDEMQAAAWNEVKNIISEFSSADIYLFTVPMWNFSIPYRLKHYFDLIVQPGLTFSIDASGQYKGLLNDKKAYIIYASGGVYTEEAGTAAYDQQKNYIRQILGFIGITDINEIVVAPTMADEDTVAKAEHAAVNQISNMF